MYDPNAIKIYTDGSAMPNPGKGGLGIIIEYPDNLELENLEISEGFLQSNNQRMELLAVIKAFEWFIENNNKISRIIIITDSEYVFYNYKNINYWRDNEWKDQYGKPYENKDLWERFLKLEQRSKLQPDIRWEKGKTRSILKRVDWLAKEGARNPINKDSGFQTGKFTSSRSGNKKTSILYPANGQTEFIRVYKKHIYGKNKNELYKITFDIYDKNQGQYTEKFFAYYEGSDGILKRNNCYKVVFNLNPKMPKIVEVEEVNYLK